VPGTCPDKGGPLFQARGGPCGREPMFNAENHTRFLAVVNPKVRLRAMVVVGGQPQPQSHVALGGPPNGGLSGAGIPRASALGLLRWCIDARPLLWEAGRNVWQ